ncbi:MAG TPA: Na+/H+ antiporter NhaC family protein [Acidobacteriota bacterium]|nr:Na+/H+ antiporter NhaC family protein [Acidobacteriota bacterium]
MQDYGWLSVLPPVLTIVLAIATKQVYLSLLLGIGLGWTIIDDWNPFAGVASSIDAIVSVFESASNTRAILFTLLMGSVIAFTQRSGGVKGFITWVESRGLVRNRKQAGLMAWVLGLVIFIESNICILVSGTVSRPLFDRYKVSREKLAYILDSTSAPKCMLLPLNGWGAYVIGLLAAQNIERPVQALISSIPFNFYAMAALLLVAVLVITGRDYGPMVAAEKRTLEGKKLNPDARPMISEEAGEIEAKEGVPARAFNMVLPVVTLVLMVPISLYVDGGGDILAGSGSKAVLWAVVTALVVAAISYRLQGVLNLHESIDLTINGAKPLLPVAALLMLAFAIGATCTELGTGPYVAKLAQAALPAAIIPALIFLLSCFIAFSTGTSWGTFAIMMPIAIPMVTLIGLDQSLTIAAVLGGGVFGDHCSPISDTSIISSMAAATDHIDHVRTQAPYAATAAALAVTLFLLLGALL